MDLGLRALVRLGGIVSIWRSEAKSLMAESLSGVEMSVFYPEAVPFSRWIEAIHSGVLLIE